MNFKTVSQNKIVVRIFIESFQCFVEKISTIYFAKNCNFKLAINITILNKKQNIDIDIDKEIRICLVIRTKRPRWRANRYLG